VGGKHALALRQKRKTTSESENGSESESERSEESEPEVETKKTGKSKQVDKAPPTKKTKQNKTATDEAKTKRKTTPKKPTKAQVKTAKRKQRAAARKAAEYGNVDEYEDEYGHEDEKNEVEQKESSDNDGDDEEHDDEASKEEARKHDEASKEEARNKVAKARKSPPKSPTRKTPPTAPKAVAAKRALELDGARASPRKGKTTEVDLLSHDPANQLALEIESLSIAQRVSLNRKTKASRDDLALHVKNLTINDVWHSHPMRRHTFLSKLYDAHLSHMKLTPTRINNMLKLVKTNAELIAIYTAFKVPFGDTKIASKTNTSKLIVILQSMSLVSQ